MVSECKKVLFIINKHSGMGFQNAVEGHMLAACENYDLECAIEYTQGRGHAISLAKEASRSGFRYVVAVGGDGTINEVACGLVNAQTPMGILPCGSGNGLARHLGISVKLKDAIDNLFESNVIAMDTLIINDKMSLNVSGIGFDGHIANLFASKSIRGLFGYTNLILKEYFTFDEFEVEITIDGKTNSHNAFILAVANSSQYGNNIKIVPFASVCDGLLHVNVVKKIPFYRWDFIYTFLYGTLENSNQCKIIEAKELKIKTSKPIPYHIDGEPSGLNDTFNVHLNPASLRVLVPKTSIRM